MKHVNIVGWQVLLLEQCVPNQCTASQSVYLGRSFLMLSPPGVKCVAKAIVFLPPSGCRGTLIWSPMSSDTDPVCFYIQF